MVSQTKTLHLPDALTYNENELLLRIAEGNEQAFSQFFLQSVRQLRPAINRLTKLETDTEEIIQETFIKVWLNRERLTEIENLDGYIYKIAFYQYQTYLRSEIAERKRQMNWQSSQAADEADSFRNNLKAADLKQLIQQAVSQLPTQRRLIYKMSREEGKNITEIAATLGISPQTVKNALVTTIKAIRNYLIAAGYSFPFLFCYVML